MNSTEESVREPKATCAPIPKGRPAVALEQNGGHVCRSPMQSSSHAGVVVLLHDRSNCLCYNPFVDYCAKEEATLVNYWTAGFEAKRYYSAGSDRAGGRRVVRLYRSHHR